MSFHTAIYLGRATARAKSDVANKLISMFLHELSKKVSMKIGRAVTEKEYTKMVEKIFGEACAYCGKDLEQDRAAVEHLDGMNRYRAGLHIVGNVVVSCKRCNSEKRRDDSLKALCLASTGWESFLAHNSTRCSESCKTCSYWREVWPDNVEKIDRLQLATKRIREFRTTFPEAEDFRKKAQNQLPKILETLYRDAQDHAASEISKALAQALDVV